MPQIEIKTKKERKKERKRKGHVTGELFQLTCGCHSEMETLLRFFFIFM